jgi:hypothetical protein
MVHRGTRLHRRKSGAARADIWDSDVRHVSQVPIGMYKDHGKQRRKKNEQRLYPRRPTSHTQHFPKSPRLNIPPGAQGWSSSKIQILEFCVSS